MLISEDAKAVLKKAKELLAERSANNVTFNDVIVEFVGKAVRLMELPADIKTYIGAFAGIVSKYPDTKGIILFGSVARGTYGKDSDIDVMVVVDKEKIKNYEIATDAEMQVEGLRAPFLERGLHLRLSITVLQADELKAMRPIYFDLLRDGIILYEKEYAMTDFLIDIRSVWHKRVFTSKGEILRWKEKQATR